MKSTITNRDNDLLQMSPADFRSIVRREDWKETTANVCADYGQANFVAVPEEYALEFSTLCLRNPRPMPIIDVGEPGDPHPRITAPQADLRTDLPKYRVFQNGKVIAEPYNVTNYWREDLVVFLIGCSWGFVWAFKTASIPFRSLGDYTTNIPLLPTGRLKGNMVCSCRAFPSVNEAVRAVQVSSRYPVFHGAPVHIGNPAAIGVDTIGRPDAFVPPWPTPPPERYETVMFWGCGITPQNVALESGVPFMITHYPGHMFVVDLKVEEFAIL